MNGLILAAQIGSINATTINGQISINNLANITITSLSGNLDVSRVTNLSTLTIGSFSGNLDASRIANIGNISINSFSGTINTLNATTVTLTGTWADSQIGSVSVGKLTAGTMTVNGNGIGLQVKNSQDSSYSWHMSGKSQWTNTYGTITAWISGYAASGAAQLTLTNASGIGTFIATGDNGKLLTYAGNSTVGMGVPPIVYSYSNMYLSSTLGNTYTTVNGAVPPAGVYRASFSLGCVAAGTGTATCYVYWTDGYGTKSFGYQCSLGSVSATAAGSQIIYSNGNSAPQFVVIYGASGAYSVQFTLERIS